VKGMSMANKSIDRAENGMEPSAKADENRVTLDTPIVRGSQSIETVTLRKPMAGELRGVALVELLQMQVEALATVLPRITTPTLTKQDVFNMNPADLLQCAQKVAVFLLPKSAMSEDFRDE